MDFQEFADWTLGEVERGHFTSSQRDRVLLSRQRFDQDDYKEIRTVVGYLGETRLVDEGVVGILSQARTAEQHRFGRPSVLRAHRPQPFRDLTRTQTPT